MKVFNLTDVETPLLKQRGLVNATIAVADKLVPPGGSEDVADEKADAVRPGIQDLIATGAAAVNELPIEYRLAKSAKQAEAPPDQPAPTPTPDPPRKTESSRRKTESSEG